VANTPLRQVNFWLADVASTHREDGTILVWQTTPLGPYPDRLSDRIHHYADTTPNTTWMAERDANNIWAKTTYADLLHNIRAIGQALLNLGLTADKPLVILSGNSVAHGLMALGAQYVGVPSAALAPAYSTTTGSYGKLHQIKAQITPGAVFADDPAAFAPALSAVFPDIPHLCATNPTWQTLLTTPVTQAVDDANRATGPDTVAKFMFTSGTTGSPKPVITTQRMLCSNMEMVRDCYAFLKTDPPILLDWAPWNHVASGNKVFNMALYNGGSYYIDAGKPAPGLFDITLQNLHDVSPTWYFNVPAGFEMLVEAMRSDSALAQTFFRNLKLMMYAGASMADHTWKALDQLAIATTGERIFLGTGLGATETSPDVLFCTEPQDVPGNIGIPMKGLTLKLVPTDGKLEAHVKGPSITPGYWRDPDLTAKAFDAEGYYNLGDALRFADPTDPAKGFFFDGRTAENFKLTTGTWVSVGTLRAKLTDALGGLARDVVIVGEGHSSLGALMVPFRPALERLVPDSTDMPDATLCAHPAVRTEITKRLKAYNTAAHGSSTRVPRVMFLTDPLDLNKGEVTDKGSLNQRAVLRHRADLAEALYTDDPRVIPNN